jgi:hypothetical protein
MKKELLSPAGDMESLLEAIHNGADAVYLAMKSFGARKFAKNFSKEEIIEAIKLCHLYGVRIYVTMNTLVKESEVEDFLEQVKYLHINGVDAIIMQDFGMISLVRKMYPNLEIHASTQANNSSLDTIKMFYEMGVKRVVVSRELTLEEIKQINFPIEIETFIHGALCICYSGNCLMSSMIGTRSGNRGECAGSCRLKYALKDNDKTSPYEYLLSTKELNTSTKFSSLLNSNITSFKIEGRMKSAEYVGFITKFYRNIFDNKNINLKEETEKLKVLFNRKFTEGNLFKTDNLMNTKSPNHIGIEIGKVLEVTNKYIKIKLTKELNQEDGIRFNESSSGMIVNFLYDKNMKLTNSVKANDIAYIDNKVDLKRKDTIYKTIDKKLVDSLKKYDLKKIPVKYKVIAKCGSNLFIKISDGENEIIKEGSPVEKSKTSPITKERIEIQLKKLGNTPFITNNINIEMDNDIFISIGEINEIRRYLTNSLIDIRSNYKKDVIEEKVDFKNIEVKKESGMVATCYKETQLLKCLSMGFIRIYVKDINLYEKYKNHKEVYYYVERNTFNISNNLVEKNLVSEYLIPKKDNLIGNYFLNIYNSYSAYYLLEKGFKNICLSVELDSNEQIEIIKALKDKFKIDINPEILVYGRCENMIIKGNILNITNDKYRYSLLDLRKREFKVYFENNKTYILDSKTQSVNIKSPSVIKRFDFYDEDDKTIEKIVNELK